MESRGVVLRSGRTIVIAESEVCAIAGDRRDLVAKCMSTLAVIARSTGGAEARSAQERQSYRRVRYEDTGATQPFLPAERTSCHPASAAVRMLAASRRRYALSRQRDTRADA